MSKNNMLGVLACLGILASTAAQADEQVILQVAPDVTKEGSLGWQGYIGAKVYFDDINVRGGVGGKQIKLVAVDQAGDISAQVKELVKEHNPAALFGTVGSAPVTKLISDKVLDNAQLPLVGPLTGSTAVANDSKNAGFVFMTRPSYATEIDKVMRQFATIGIKKMAVIYSENQTGRELLDLIKASGAKQGQSVEIALAEPKDPAKAAAMADEVMAKEHQAVLMAVTAETAANFVKRYRQQGGAAQLVALSVVEGAQLAELAGAKFAHGTAVVQVAPSPRNDSYAVVREFTTNYRKYGPYTEEPTEAMMEGYLAAKVIVEGFKRGGGGRAALARGVSQISGYDAGGVNFAFAPGSRSGAKYIELSVIDREGRIVR